MSQGPQHRRKSTATWRAVSPASAILLAPNYNGNPGLSTSWTGTATNVPNLAPGGGAGMTIGPQRGGAQINVLFCNLDAQTMTFGPATTAGTFKTRYPIHSA